MAFWAFIIMLWLGGQLLAQITEGTGAFLSTPLAANVRTVDRYIPIKSAQNFPASSNEFFIGSERIAYSRIVHKSQCVRFALVIPSSASCLDTGLTGRGVGGTVPALHKSGTLVISSSTANLSGLGKFQTINLETGAGVITLPMQLGGALADFLSDVILWDYNFLEGHGWYLKVWLYGLNGLIVIGLVRLFAGPFANMMSGVGSIVSRVLGVVR